MKILLSNDDGYFAPGLNILAEHIAKIADITVVAPERNRSGASNSLTLDRPLSVKKAANGFFYVNGLTDRRVACKQAPFDHPALRLTNGHTGDHIKIEQNGVTGEGRDDYLDLPAVGATGLPTGQCLRNDDGSVV